MEPLQKGEDGASANSAMESWHQLPVEEDPSQFLGQTSALHEASHQHGLTLNPDEQISIVDDSRMQQVADKFESLQLEFQDSHLSPALTLIPQGRTLALSDSTLLHQTDSEFVPLRGIPDLSMASGRYHGHLSHLDITSHEQASLSQHPLGVTAAISEGGSSCCSLSQHSLSPGSLYQATQVDDNDDYEEEHKSRLKSNKERPMEGEEQTDADLDTGETAASVVSGDAPPQFMVELLEKDVRVVDSHSSAVSSASETAAVLTHPHLIQNQSQHTDIGHYQAPGYTSEDVPKPRPSGNREQPQGGTSSSMSQKKTTGKGSMLLTSDMSMTSNITVRSSKTQPDCNADSSRRLYLSFSQSEVTGSENKSQSLSGTKNASNASCVTPASGIGVYVPGLQRLLWASGSQMAADGSFLTSHPVSQSTPAVLFNRAAPVMTKLSPVYSHQNTIDTLAMSTKTSSSKDGQMHALQLGTTDPQTMPLHVSQHVFETSSAPVEAHTEQHVLPLHHEVSDTHVVPSTGLPRPARASKETSFRPPNLEFHSSQSEKEFKDQDSNLSAGRVHSLPTLNYLQKVDAWKANQSSVGSFYDRLALQGVESVSAKKKVPNSDVSDGQSPRSKNETSSEFDLNASAQASQPAVVDTSSLPKNGSPRHGDFSAAGRGVGAPPSASPIAQSHSHSSLSTVVMFTQQEKPQQNLQLPLASSDAISSYLHESPLPSGKLSEQNPADQPETTTTDSVKPSAFLRLGQFSDVSSNRNVDNALSSSHGSWHGEQSLLASVGAASSVVSLEVDNYAPYWTSRPGSPPPSFELNIEDRIPLYLHNLGIDQSPSTILNPFTPRGPIREPEFSPTDLCTIKGSVGTPTKSTQPSEGGSPQKETFSSSSLLSANSTASLPRRLTIQKPDRPASPGSVRMVRCQASDSTPDPYTSSHPFSVSQESATPQREGSYGLPARLSPDSVPHSGIWLEPKKGDSSLVGSGTLQEIRRLLGQAESLVSDHSSLASSPASHCYSESDASFLSLRRNTQAHKDDSFLSVGGKTSLISLPRSSSDSALKESTSSSCGPLQLSAHSDHMISEGTTPSQTRDANLKSRDLRVAPRRTEPEGCSAADPDRVGTVSLPVVQGVGSVPSASDDLQQSHESAENTGVSSPENSSSTRSPAEVELGVLSDSSSSESSLAARVAKLLRSESPVSVVTSRPSTTDPEESRAREWIMMKVSGRQCESLELNIEDRNRIEEIKRELLLHTKQAKSGSDSESSAQSSVGPVPEPTAGFTAVRSAEDCLSEQLQRDSTAPLHTPLSHTLEARVRQIALREGLNLPTPLSSITSASTRHTPSPHLEAHLLTAQDDPTHTSLKYADKESRQTPVSDRGPGIEEKVDKEGNRFKTDRLVVQSAAPKSISIKKSSLDVAPSTKDSPQKPHLSHIHVTIPPKPHQNMPPRLHSPADDSHSPLHKIPHSDRTLPSVSSSSEGPRTPAISESSAAEDRHAGIASAYSQIRPRYPQAFTSAQRLPGSTRPPSFQTAAVPPLLPYKPHGSTELFYMPQTDPDLSAVRSDTTMESSHPGSDDAVPPRFTTEILGSRELEDSGVTPKHKEGIYSKRAKMSRCLQDSKVASATLKHTSGSHGQLLASRTSDGLDRGQEAVYRFEQAEEEEEEGEEEFAPLHMEADYSTDNLHHQSHHTVKRRSFVPDTLPVPIKPTREEHMKEKDMKSQELGLEINTSLDQLWKRFSERWSLQEPQPTNEGEMSLLERLERLSRLLNSTTPPQTPPKKVCSREERGKRENRTRELEPKRAKGKDTSRRVEDNGRSQVGAPPKPAWVEDPVQASHTSQDEEQENAHRYPAERDESASVSVETSSSQSTIDTSRLLRAFGPRRVHSGSVKVPEGHRDGHETSGSLLKLYNTINKQKRSQNNGISEHHLVSAAATEVISADESTASADSLSSPSTYTLPSQRGPTRTLATKKRKVKVVSRGIQAGDLEIVVNGTRRHTRDVGTIFPSPCNARDPRAPTATHAEVQVSRGVPARSQTVLRREGIHKSNQTCYPDGVSWFVPADELKQDARKENEPQSEGVPSASHAWFEPYSRTQPWRQPLREPLRERHIQLEREKPSEPKAPAESDSRKPSALVRLSLQEALELNRPDFVSHSRERMKRLCLLAEERKMQAVFNREREELFNRPLPLQQPVAAPPPLPSKRVIPVKEMVQRSKRIYAQLPEVQKRKQEEKRKAEYSTYRLNARLFNKKVTNHVLGRRAPWQ